MRTASLIIVCVLAFAVANAIDFSDMVQGHKEELGDGHYRITHTLHNTFVDPDSGKKTHVHLDSMAEISHKWKFVAVHDFGVTGGLKCNGQTLTNTNITVTVADAQQKAALVAAAQQPFAVVHSKHLRCSLSAVFGHVDSVTSNGFDVTIQMTNAKFENVLRNANVQFRTNHFRSKHFPPKEAGETARRGMEAQWHIHWPHIHTPKFIKHASHDIKHFYNHVVHDVAHVSQDLTTLCEKAENDMKKIVNIVDGDFTVDKTWTLAQHSTGDASLMTNALIQPPANSQTHQTYTHFDIEVVFSMVVKGYKLDTLTAAVEGDADLAAAWAAGIQFKGSQSISLGTIQIESINFAIGVVPVHIQPSIPIHLNLNYDVQAGIQFGAIARGHVEYGIQYANGHFSTIKVHTFSFDKYHGQPEQPQLSIEVALVPQFVIEIDFLGGPTATATIAANANMVPQNDKYYIQFNANLGVTIEADIALRIKGHTVFGPRMFGPYKLASQVYNLGQIEIFNPSWVHQGRSYKALEVSQGVQIPIIGTTWTLDVPPQGDRKASQFVTFQLYGIDVDIKALYLMGTFSYNALNPWTKAPMYATITAPYVMTPTEKDNEWDLSPFNRSETFVSVTDASLQTDTPSFTAMLVDGMLVLKSQVQGETLINSGEMLAMTQKETTTKLGSMSPPKPEPTSNDDKSKETIAYSVAGVALLVAAVALVVAFVSRRRGGNQPVLVASDSHVPLQSE